MGSNEYAVLGDAKQDVRIGLNQLGTEICVVGEDREQCEDAESCSSHGDCQLGWTKDRQDPAFSQVYSEHNPRSDLHLAGVSTALLHLQNFSRATVLPES